MALVKRKPKSRIEDLPNFIKDSLIAEVSKTLTKQIDKEVFEKKYASVKTILTLVGAGLFLGASVIMSNLPLALKPFLDHKRKEEFESWKRFNIPYLRRTLMRLEKQKLVELDEKEGIQIVKITDSGKRKILKFALDELAVEKPRIWDGRWHLVSYDIPGELHRLRAIFREYLKAWGFYQLHESVFLHAYPCEKQVEFLREYLGIGEYVRILKVFQIERAKEFRDYFGVK